MSSVIYSSSQNPACVGTPFFTGKTIPGFSLPIPKQLNDFVGLVESHPTAYYRPARYRPTTCFRTPMQRRTSRTMVTCYHVYVQCCCKPVAVTREEEHLRNCLAWRSLTSHRAHRHRRLRGPAEARPSYGHAVGRMWET